MLNIFCKENSLENSFVITELCLKKKKRQHISALLCFPFDSGTEGSSADKNKVTNTFQLYKNKGTEHVVDAMLPDENTNPDGVLESTTSVQERQKSVMATGTDASVQSIVKDMDTKLVNVTIDLDFAQSTQTESKKVVELTAYTS